MRRHVVIIDQELSFIAASDKGNSNDVYTGYMNTAKELCLGHNLFFS